MAVTLLERLLERLREDFHNPAFLALCFVGLVGLIAVVVVGWLT